MQIPARQSQSFALVVAFWHARDLKVAFAEHHAMPFGASAAVNNFNRVGRAPRFLFAHFLHIPSSQYFDDYTCNEPVAIASDGCACAMQALQILGFGAEVKQQPASSYSSLGLNFDLSEAWTHQRVVIKNTEKRLHSLMCELNALTRLPPGRAASLRGRLSFSAGQHYGRCGRVGLRPLSARQYAQRCGDLKWLLNAALIDAVEWWRSFLMEVPPRQISLRAPTSRPVLLFTDGWQGQVQGVVRLGVGAVLVLPEGMSFFGCFVPPRVVELWSDGGEKTMMINQAELLPALLARRTWRRELQSARLIHFLDNDGCRDALVRGYSPVRHSARLVGATLLLDAKLSILSWFTRVPSFSNIADGPSRMDFADVLRLGASQVEPDWPSLEDLLSNSLPRFP